MQCIMSGHTESTSNSMKFAPLPMSALLELMPVKKPDSPDSRYTTVEDSDDSTVETVVKDPPDKKFSHREINNIPSSAVKVQRSAVKDFASEKKPVLNRHNKENINQSLPLNKISPKPSAIPQSSQKVLSNLNPKSDVLNVAWQQQNIVNIKQTEHVRKTPEIHKNTTNQKKSATPKIKSGIRRFTPGSGKRSNKKTPQKLLTSSSKESVRCLFPENNSKAEEPVCPPPPAPVPETPMNRKPLQQPCMATPSYPQGVVRSQAKVLFKTTVIKRKNYMYIKKLGTGGSSEVYKVLEVGSSCEYAVKCVNLGTDPELARGYVNEVRLLKELQNSDRVIQLFDYEYDRENKFLRVVMEVGETDLSSFLKARGAGLPPALVLHYWEEMLLAVHHIHQHGVIHADLKPANFLLVCGRLKLIDFGIASSISCDATSVVRSQATGTYSYISPEALMGGAGGYGGDQAQPIKISFRSDVWSLGCILYSMVYGRTPFSHIPNLAKLAAILDPNHRIHYPPLEHLPQSLIAALKWCLTYNARSRPSVKELLSIRYMQQPPKNPLPPPLLEKLRTLVTPEEYALLQTALV